MSDLQRVLRAHLNKKVLNVRSVQSLLSRLHDPCFPLLRKVIFAHLDEP